MVKLMKINDFSEILKQLLEERLNRLNELIDKKYLGFDSAYSLSNLLRCAETPTHFIGELLGTKKFEPTEKISIKFLQGKSEKISTTNSYFMPFSKDISQPVINISGVGNTLQSLLLITNDDYLTLQKLPFPIPLAKINRNNGDYPLNITDNVDLLILKDMTLINIPGFFYFYRYIPFALITKKNVTEQDIKNRMDIDFQLDISCLIQNIPVNYITGISYCYSEPNAYVSSQLMSFSNQIIKEPYIDKYIQEHKSIFANALGYKDVRKISLKCTERSIDDPQGKPDFVLIKKDNTFDILDLKTGAIKLKSLTKGKKLRKGQKIRIRFVDYVSELISQLDGYKKYFEYEENIQFIKNKYGLNIDSANMKLIGIVGNQNNFDTGEVDSALRPYKSHIKIISYYDLANMILRYNPATTLAISD
jgi:hypothetical protein